MLKDCDKSDITDVVTVEAVRNDCYRLQESKQRLSEDVDDFVTRLWEQTAFCDLQCTICNTSLTDDVLASNTSMTQLGFRVFENGDLIYTYCPGNGLLS